MSFRARTNRARTLSHMLEYEDTFTTADLVDDIGVVTSNHIDILEDENVLEKVDRGEYRVNHGTAEQKYGDILDNLGVNYR